MCASVYVYDMDVRRWEVTYRYPRHDSVDEDTDRDRSRPHHQPGPTFGRDTLVAHHNLCPCLPVCHHHLFSQGFNNTAFWARLCAAVLPRLRSFDPNTLPALVTALQAAQQLPAPASASASSGSAGSAVAAAAGGSTPQAAVAAEALRLLSRSETLAALAPARLADAASLLAGLGPALGVAVDARLVEAVQVGLWRRCGGLDVGHVCGGLGLCACEGVGAGCVDGWVG